MFLHSMRVQSQHPYAYAITLPGDIYTSSLMRYASKPLPKTCDGYANHAGQIPPVPAQLDFYPVAIHARGYWPQIDIPAKIQSACYRDDCVYWNVSQTTVHFAMVEPRISRVIGFPYWHRQSWPKTTDGENEDLSPVGQMNSTNRWISCSIHGFVIHRDSTNHSLANCRKETPHRYPVERPSQRC